MLVHFFSNYKTTFIKKVTKVVEMSQMDCVDSGNRLQKRKLGPWSLGERKAKVTQEEEEGEGKDTVCSQDRKCARKFIF